MDEMLALAEPTSSAATRETEPEVVAGIASGEIGVEVPTAIHSGGSGGLGLWRLALVLGGGMALGYGVSRWLRA